MMILRSRNSSIQLPRVSSFQYFRLRIKSVQTFKEYHHVFLIFFLHGQSLILALRKPIPLREVRMILLLVPDKEGVPLLVGHELVQVREEIEEAAGAILLVFEVQESEFYVILRLQKVRPCKGLAFQWAHTYIWQRKSGRWTGSWFKYSRRCFCSS